MLGIFRNGVRLASKPLSLFQPVLSSGGKVASKETCQQCHTVNDWNPIVQVPSRLFGTLRTLVSSTTLQRENNGLLMGDAQFPAVTGFENSSLLSGGPLYMQVRGMKYKGRVKRRCKDCYFMWINGMLYNLCKTHPRHKHGLKPPYYSNQRLLTHATMSAKRPW